MKSMSRIKCVNILRIGILQFVPVAFVFQLHPISPASAGVINLGWSAPALPISGSAWADVSV